MAEETQRFSVRRVHGVELVEDGGRTINVTLFSAVSVLVIELKPEHAKEIVDGLRAILNQRRVWR